MANDMRSARTPRIARMLRELEGPPSGADGEAPGFAASRRTRRSRRGGFGRAGRRLLVGVIVITGVALTVATDFLQLRAITGDDAVRHTAVSVMPAGYGDPTK